jgi:membrane-associated phospholipid phosphatase
VGVAWALIGRRWRVVLACAAPAITIAVVEGVLKPLVNRQDVSGVLQFPSGHVAGAASIATLIVILAVPAIEPRWVRVAVVGAGVLACGLMLVGVIASEMHWAIDAVAGLPTGIAVTLGWCRLVDAVGDRIGQLRRVSSRASGPVRSR